MASHLEQKIDRCIADLATLEEHVQHIAATLVSIVEVVQKTPALVREINAAENNRVDL